MPPSLRNFGRLRRPPPNGVRRCKGTVAAVLVLAGWLGTNGSILLLGAVNLIFRRDLEGLERELGCRIPVQPGKGYSITMRRPARCPSIPLIFPETRVAVTPMQTGYRLGSTMEFAGYDESLRPERLQLLLRHQVVGVQAEDVEGWPACTIAEGHGNDAGFLEGVAGGEEFLLVGCSELRVPTTPGWIDLEKRELGERAVGHRNHHSAMRDGDLGRGFA